MNWPSLTNAHRAQRTTRDVDVLLTQEGFEHFQQAYVDSDYDRADSRPRWFVDRRNGVTVDVLISGRFPDSGRPGPIAFPYLVAPTTEHPAPLAFVPETLLDGHTTP